MNLGNREQREPFFRDKFPKTPSFCQILNYTRCEPRGWADLR